MRDEAYHVFLAFLSFLPVGLHFMRAWGLVLFWIARLCHYWSLVLPLWVISWIGIILFILTIFSMALFVNEDCVRLNFRYLIRSLRPSHEIHILLLSKTPRLNCTWIPYVGCGWRILHYQYVSMIPGKSSCRSPPSIISMCLPCVFLLLPLWAPRFPGISGLYIVIVHISA